MTGRSHHYPQDISWDSARRQLKDGLLSVLMPAHNLESRIAGNVRDVRALLAGRIPFELVVIDDGSTDGTAAELLKLKDEIPELRPVILPRNLGKGSALSRGFEESRGSLVAFLDGDLDLPPAQLAVLFEVMERERADVVIGSKRHPDSVLYYPWHRRVISATYFFLVKLLFGMPIRDTQTGLKLFRRSVLEWVIPRMLVKQFAFDLEILAMAHERGYRIAEAPVLVDYHGSWGTIRPSSVRSIVNDTLAVFYRIRFLRYYQSIPDLRIPSPPPLVSILIACPAPTPYLEEALAGIARQTYRRFEVILLPDVASGRSWPPEIREIPTGRRRPAEKRNIGIQHARGEITAFLDDDAYPADDWLARALAYFSDPQVAAVGGPAVTPSDDPFLAAMSGRVYANPLVSGSYVYRYQPDRVRSVDDFPSCNLFARTADLQRLQGFRIDFWPGEDTYLCMELVHKLGKRIMYEPRSLVYHHRRKLFLPHLRQVGRYGLHRGYFARRFPVTSRRIAYMVPSLFVLGLVGGGLLSFWSRALAHLYLSAVIVYAVITLLSSASRQPLIWLVTWLGMVLTHLVYGTRFIVGFLSRRLPSEVERFDHPSEESVA